MYSKDFPLNYDIIIHEEQKSWIKNIVVVSGIICFGALLFLDFYSGNNIDTIRYILVAILVIDGFAYSYLTFYKANFRKTGFFTITDKTIIIKNMGEDLTCERDDITELKITLNIIDYVPAPMLKTWLSVRDSRSARLDGSGNFIEFRYNDKFYSFELFINDKPALMLLSKRTKEWNAI